MSTNAIASPQAHDRQAADAGTKTETAARPARRFIRIVIMLVVASAALAWGIRYGHHMLTHAETDDAYVTGSIHTVSSRLAGVVQNIMVKENAEVVEGQPLIELDTRDLDLRVDQAQASVRQAEAQVIQNESEIVEVVTQNHLFVAGIEMAKANVTRDEASLTKAKHDYDRAKNLYEGGKAAAVSEADFDTAMTTVATSTATLTATRAVLEAAKAYAAATEAKETAARAKLDAAKAQLRAAQSALKDAELQRSYATITAPCKGRISRQAVEVGNRIQPGQALYALVEPEVWVEANFKETQLDGLHVGSPVEIMVDALPGRTLHGHIESFSPASGAQFALLPPDNATGNFTKVVQRVPVKIVFEADSIRDLSGKIRPGLSTVVSVAVK